MAGQLPSAAVPAAAGVLVYTFFNLFCALLTIWLTWVHHERLSYVACICYFIAISIVASIIQQFHDSLYWVDVVKAEFAHKMRDPTNPQLAIANGSQGMDLVLYYIQYFCYNVEAMFVMFWAAQLAQSVYGLSHRARLRNALRTLNNVGKVFSVVLPLITIPSLQSPAIQRNYIAFILLADVPLMLSLLIGLCLVLSILAQYVRSRKQFLHWSSQQNDGGSSNATSEGAHKRTQSKALYDRWLLVRFTVAFIILGVFEITNTLFQVSAVQNNKQDAASTKPDFSAERAIPKILLFMPGVTPGVVMFLIFGTTKVFRTYMCNAVLPRRWQRVPDGAYSGPSRSVYSSRGDSQNMLKQPLPVHRREQAWPEGRIAVENRVEVTVQPAGRAVGKQDQSSDEWLMLPIMNQSKNGSASHGR